MTSGRGKYGFSYDHAGLNAVWSYCFSDCIYVYCIYENPLKNAEIPGAYFWLERN